MDTINVRDALYSVCTRFNIGLSKRIFQLYVSPDPYSDKSTISNPDTDFSFGAIAFYRKLKQTNT